MYKDTKKIENLSEFHLSNSERQPCEVWTRVMGYHRPVSEFNKGKKSEYYSRKCFSEEKAKEKLDELVPSSL